MPPLTPPLPVAPWRRSSPSCLPAPCPPPPTVPQAAQVAQPSLSAEEQERQRREAEEARLAELRRHGTPVTPEAFAEWRVRFEAEQGLAAARLEGGGGGRKEGAGLTGKQWFMQQEAAHLEVGGSGRVCVCGWVGGGASGACAAAAAAAAADCGCERLLLGWRRVSHLRLPCHLLALRLRSQSWTRTRPTARTTEPTGPAMMRYSPGTPRVSARGVRRSRAPAAAQLLRPLGPSCPPAGL